MYLIVDQREKACEDRIDHSMTQDYSIYVLLRAEKRGVWEDFFIGDGVKANIASLHCNCGEMVLTAFKSKCY
jgi:hypothetical protein